MSSAYTEAVSADCRRGGGQHAFISIKAGSMCVAGKLGRAISSPMYGLFST